MNTKENLKQAKAEYDNAFMFWHWSGQPEACDHLNDAAIKLVKAYKAEYPEAVGIKGTDKVVDISGKIHAFHCNHLILGTPENLKRMQEIAAIEAISDRTDRFWEFMETMAANSVCLVWS